MRSVDIAFEAALREGLYAPLDDRAAVGLTAVGVVLGIAMLILVLFLSEPRRPAS